MVAVTLQVGFLLSLLSVSPVFDFELFTSRLSLTVLTTDPLMGTACATSDFLQLVMHTRCNGGRLLDRNFMPVVPSLFVPGVGASFVVSLLETTLAGGITL